MPAKEQERTLSEYVVREAVEKGMDTPLRDVIVEAVEESEGKSSGGRMLPLAGALVGLGAAAGYLLGSRGTELESEDLSLESVEEPEIIDEVTGGSEESEGSDEMGTEAASETGADGSSGSWLRRIVIGVGIVAAVAFARRRMQSSEEDEWEPIEEFETAVSDEDEDEGEEEEGETEAESEEEEEEEMEEAEAEGDEEEEEEEEE